VPQLCPSFALRFPPLCSCFAIVEAAHAEPAHTHTHTHTLSLSFPSFPFPFCSGRATNNRGPLYLSLHRTILDRRALVLSAISPSHSPNSRVDHSSIVQYYYRRASEWCQASTSTLSQCHPLPISSGASVVHFKFLA